MQDNNDKQQFGPVGADDVTPEGADTPSSPKGEQTEMQKRIQQLVERFKALPPNKKVVVIAGFIFVIMILRSLGGGDEVRRPAQQQTPQPQQQTTQQQQAAEEENQDDSVQLIQPQRSEVTTRWIQQQLTDLRQYVDTSDQETKQSVEEIKQQVSKVPQIEQRLNAIEENVNSLSENIRVQFEEFNAQNRETLGQIADQIRRQQEMAPVQPMGVKQPNGNGQPQSQTQTPRRKSGRISQTPLSAVGGVEVGSENALLAGVVQQKKKIQNLEQDLEAAKRPFVPPLGFIRATLLNGVDALVGGRTTPGLVRLSGSYKTAMNSTVSLDGCFALVEFEGDISTERALGKPSRMTCVYPDQGTVTYNVSGYVVDAEDGIIGIPGVFYEGDASRIAAAMAAEFAAGVAEIVEENQQTTTVSAEGHAQQFLTGSEARSQIASGAADAVSSLRDYLVERANRVLPFVRVDSTRDLHVVLLSGTELRDEGQPWTLLFSGEKYDQARAKIEREQRRLEEEQLKQQNKQQQNR